MLLRILDHSNITTHNQAYNTPGNITIIYIIIHTNWTKCFKNKLNILIIFDIIKWIKFRGM